jgi:hypothetical protein
MAVGLVCAVSTPPVSADEPDNNANPVSLFDARFTVAFGGYFSTVDSDLRLDSTSGPGSSIDLEDDLGLDKWSASAWLSFNWRFLPRHQLHVEWFQLNRDGIRAASRDFEIGGSTFTAGVQLDSALDINIGRVTYGYSILRDDRNDLSFDIGLHLATFKATITGTGLISVDGAPLVNTTHTESSSTLTFPLPHLGLNYSRKLTPRLTANANLVGFYIELEDFRGYLFQADGMLAYQVTDSFGVGGGVKYYRFHVTDKDADGDTVFDMDFIGPAIFLYGNF